MNFHLVQPLIKAKFLELEIFTELGTIIVISWAGNSMRNKNKNLCLWIIGFTFSLLFFVSFLSSPGFGNGLFLRYLPLVEKDYPLPPPPTATPITTTPVGPVGGTFTALAADPNQNQNVYAGSYVSGVYKTYNQGDTWYRQNTGLGNLKIQSLAIHPTDSSIVYAGTYGGGIYKSTNGGSSWGASNGGVLGNHIVYDIDIDPNDPNVIYAATRINNSLRGYLYKSSDAGASWNLLINGGAFSSLDYFYDIDVNPLNSNELYLTAHEHGFYKSTNAGITFSAINTGVSDLSARSFVLDAAYPGRVYGAVWHGMAVYRSSNSGASWSNSTSGLPDDAKVFRLYANPFGGTQKRVFACTYGNGLYSTDNFAQNWTSRGLSSQRLYDFVVADGSPQRWFAATESNGVYRTNANSTSWNRIMGDLRLNAVTAILKDNLTGNTYAAVYGKGVYAVDQTGIVWEEITQDLPDKAFIDLAIVDRKLHALTETGLYLLEAKGWDSMPSPAVGEKKDNTNLDLLSAKIGLSDEMLTDHLEQAYDVKLTEDEMSTVIPIKILSASENLYMGTIGNGLFLKVNEEWTPVGFDGQSVFDMVFDQESKEIFVIACEFTTSCRVFQSLGSNWAVVQSNLQDLQVNKLLITEKGLVAATSSGIFLFNSETSQWTLLGGQGKNWLSISVTEKCKLAAVGEGVVLYSQDCGESWLELTVDDWHYQSAGFIGDQSNLLLIGSQEAGAAILPLQ